MIRGESVACIGFKEALRAKISEGVLVSAPELVRITVDQFNQLFENARGRRGRSSSRSSRRLKMHVVGPSHFVAAARELFLNNNR